MFENSTVKYFILDFLKNFKNCFIWDVIYKADLILRTIVLEGFNNSPYFKSYGRLFRKNSIFITRHGISLKSNLSIFVEIRAMDLTCRSNIGEKKTFGIGVVSRCTDHGHCKSLW